MKIPSKDQTLSPAAEVSAWRKTWVSSVAAALTLSPFFAASAGMRRVLGQTPNPPTTQNKVMTPSDWPDYDSARQRSDQYIASIFGDVGAVAAANGFEPFALHGHTMYRGPWSKGDRAAHLGDRMHLYGSADGNSDTGLYLPPGFRYVGPMLTANGKANSGHTFFYKHLGTQKNVYLLAFHVRDFEVDATRQNAAGSIRIGAIGGPGGVNDDPRYQLRQGKLYLYKHAHIEFSPAGGSLRLGERKRLAAKDLFPTPSEFEPISSATNTAY